VLFRLDLALAVTNRQDVRREVTACGVHARAEWHAGSAVEPAPHSAAGLLRFTGDRAATVAIRKATVAQSGTERPAFSKEASALGREAPIGRRSLSGQKQPSDTRFQVP